MAEKEFYNVIEVCETLGLSRDRVYEYLRASYIKGTRITRNSAWLIHRDEIERIKREGGIKVKSSDTTSDTGFRKKKLVAPYVDMQKHRDTIIKAVIPELDIDVFPTRDFDLAIFWSRRNEPTSVRKTLRSPTMPGGGYSGTARRDLAQDLPRLLGCSTVQIP